jgi:MinD-like ATPase involved in chromosome partitioning or flagellar assembly
VEEQIRPVATCALRLRGELNSRYGRDHGVSDLGSLPDWESALTDRVPVVIRAPDSALARAYQSICDTLLCKITQFRSKLSASHVSQVSAGIRSG